MGDSFYEYILKAWIQSGQTDVVARQMYDNAMEAIVNKLIQTSAGGLVYASDMKDGSLDHSMDHLACFSGKRMNFSLFKIIFILIDNFYECSFFWQVDYLRWVPQPKKIRIRIDTWRLERA